MPWVQGCVHLVTEAVSAAAGLQWAHATPTKAFIHTMAEFAGHIKLSTLAYGKGGCGNQAGSGWAEVAICAT